MYLNRTPRPGTRTQAQKPAYFSSPQLALHEQAHRFGHVLSDLTSKRITAVRFSAATEAGYAALLECALVSDVRSDTGEPA